MAAQNITLDTLADIRTRSELAWEAAIDTAGPEYPGGSKDRVAAMRALAHECDAEYQAAIDELVADYSGARLEAIKHLAQARRLEGQGGDDCHAREALDLLVPAEVSS